MRTGARTECDVMRWGMCVIAATAAVMGAGVASADPGGDYDDGMATSICQMLDTMSGQQVVDALQDAWSDFFMAANGRPMNEQDGWRMLHWGVDRKCPNRLIR